MRDAGKNLTRKRGLSYGTNCVKRNEQAYKKELENIYKMRELRERGYSYNKIAEIFTALKIPTKTRKAKWSSKTIYSILNRHN